jgi:[protein-PII] uridylyltransferase
LRADAELRQRVEAGRKALQRDYLHQPKPGLLLHRHARLVDKTIKAVWERAGVPRSATLVATGGYGRGELFPNSDIDLLVLLAREPGEGELGEKERGALERLIGELWDIGLEIGHSVRTVPGCLEAASGDVTVRTTLMEARYLAGSRKLFLGLQGALARAMDAVAFFKAKKLEQEQRHAKHQDSPYSLEPNLKEAPGGLRDLQVIQWIARASGIGARWRDLVAGGLLERGEARSLARHEALLQDLRIRLHYLAGRREDRLVFDLQHALAAQLGLRDTRERRASEVMMQRYYQTAKGVTQLNTILMQNLEARLAPRPDSPARPLNERFEVRSELLHLKQEGTFVREPTAILECFLLMMQHQELRGMTARTLRALWRSRSSINPSFRKNPVARLLFLHILQQPRGIVHEFRRMNQYDVLGNYLPEFGRIVGQMQHDLFHVYTVDQHILMVLRNLRRFTMPELAHEFPLCSELSSGFERRWLLYVAALYHDIAKGRGGDHSHLGAADVRGFARKHGLSTPDRELLEFLVENHLTMSQVAQKQDVHDPEIVAAFAARVGSERRLVALYLLTVADVRGTSPKVWNAWKAKLLEDLFRATRRVLTGEPLARDAALAEKQAEAMRLLRPVGRRQGSPVGAARYRIFPAPRRAGDRLAHAQPALPRRDRQAGGQGAPGAVRRGLAGDDLYAGQGGAVRAHLRLLRARRFQHCGSESAHQPQGLRARYLRRHGPGQQRALPGPHRHDRSRSRRRGAVGRAAAGAARRAPVAPRAPLPDLALGGCPPGRARRLPRPDRRRRRPAGPALQRGAHSRPVPDQPADGAHQHARRPCRGRILDLGRNVGRFQGGAAARAGTARRAHSSAGSSCPGNSASLKPNCVRSRMRRG